ncbi:MAG: FliI/YscN family ATPase [Pseudomonadota bacterium]
MMGEGAQPRWLPASARIWGTLMGCDGAVATVAGLAGLARLGDGVEIDSGSGEAVPAEIVAIEGNTVSAMLMAPAEGLVAGGRCYLTALERPRPSDGWLGCVVDAYGRLSDGRPAPQGVDPVSLRRTPPAAAERRGLGARMATGLAITDTALPLCRGQRIGLFAGSGVGKSMLLATLARAVEADVVVVGLIGERGREVGEFVRDKVGAAGMARTVVVAASSDQGALVKRRAAFLTLAVAEHFRDHGRHVVCLFDSVTRFAEAHREIALAAGEAPALRAFPPSTAAEIATLCERAGPGEQAQGDITAVFTVLVAGSDMEEPVADMVRGVLDGHIVLSREIAERGRFPAIDLRRSVSRSAPAAWQANEAELATELRSLVAAQEEAAPMIQAGLYQPGNDAVLDRAVKLWPELDRFVGAQSPGASIEESIEMLEAALKGRARAQPKLEANKPA